MVNVPQTPIVNAGNKYVDGLKISYSASTLSVLPGSCRDSTNTDDLVLNVTTQIGLKVVGLNGFDSPALGGRFYAVYVVGDSTKNNPTGIILSLNFVTNSAPYLPSGYDMWRRIGYCATGVQPILDILQWNQSGEGQERHFYYDVPITCNLSGGQSLTFADFNVISPPNENEAMFVVELTATTADSLLHLTPGGTSPAEGIVQFGGLIGKQVTTLSAPVSKIGASCVARYKVTAATDTAVIRSVGFMDEL